MFNKNNGYTISALMIIILVSSIFLSGLAVFKPHPYHIFIAIIALLIFTSALIRTDLALIILILSMLLSPELRLGMSGSRAVVIRADDVVLFVVFLGWFAKMAVNKELGLLRSTPINTPILVYILVCILASGVGVLRGTVHIKHTFFYLLKYIEYFLLFFIISNNVKNKRQIKIFIAFMLLTCLVVDIYALTYVFSSGMRATAPFEGKIGEANTLAGYLVIMMSVMLGIFVYSKSLKDRFLTGSFFIFTMATFFYTQSRSGLLAFLFMYAVFLMFSRGHRPLLFMFTIAGIILLPLIMPHASIERYKATFKPGVHKEAVNILGSNIPLDESAAKRVTSFKKSLADWSARPILGYGVPSGDVSDVQYGRLLRETGVVGLVSFVWLVVSVLRAGWKSFNDIHIGGFYQGLCLALVASLAGLLVMGFGAEVFVIVRIMEPFWFLAAIVITLPEVCREAGGSSAWIREEAAS